MDWEAEDECTFRIDRPYGDVTMKEIEDIMNQREYLVDKETSIAADKWTRAGSAYHSSSAKGIGSTKQVYKCGLKSRTGCQAKMMWWRKQDESLILRNKAFPHDHLMKSQR